MMAHGLYSGLADLAYRGAVFFAGSRLLMSFGTAWGCACVLVDCLGYICYLPVQVAFAHLVCVTTGSHLLLPQCQCTGLHCCECCQSWLYLNMFFACCNVKVLLLGMHLQLDQYLSGVWHCCVWFARSANPSYVWPMWLVLLLCVWPSATDQVGTDHAACVLLVALVQQVFGRTIQLFLLWQLLVRKGLC